MNGESLSFDLVHPQPLMVVISGPSGVGKDAVLKSLQKRDLNLHVVVTMTSREPRPGEIDGVDYHFVTKEQFEELITQDGFIEHALVYADHKGIPRKQIEDAVASNRDIILRVDVQGARSLRELFPEAVLIFLIPTHEKEWLERLENRETETAEKLQVRIDKAKSELESLQEFDYVVVNAQDRLEETVDAIEAIIVAEHHRVIPRKFSL